MDEYCQGTRGLDTRRILRVSADRVSHTGAVARVCPREALCALLRKRVGRGYPGRRMCGVWGVFAAFSSGCARSKMAQDKARYRFDRRVPTKPRNAGLFTMAGVLSVLENCRVSAIYTPRKHRCTNDFTAIYEEMMQTWKKTEELRLMAYPETVRRMDSSLSLLTAKAAVSLLRGLCTSTWVILSLTIQLSISAKLCS